MTFIVPLSFILDGDCSPFLSWSFEKNIINDKIKAFVHLQTQTGVKVHTWRKIIFKPFCFYFIYSSFFFKSLECLISYKTSYFFFSWSVTILDMCLSVLCGCLWESILCLLSCWRNICQLINLNLHFIDTLQRRNNNRRMPVSLNSFQTYSVEFYMSIEMKTHTTIGFPCELVLLQDEKDTLN